MIEKFKDLSIIEQIDFLKNELEIEEENIASICNINSPNEVVPLLLLIGRLRENDLPYKYERIISDTLFSSFSKFKEGIELFMDEILKTKLFENNIAQEIIKELNIIIKNWDPKSSQDAYVDILVKSLRKTRD